MISVGVTDRQTFIILAVLLLWDVIRNMCAKFGEDRIIFRYRSEVTFDFRERYRQTDMYNSCCFVTLGCPLGYKKSFSSIREKDRQTKKAFIKLLLVAANNRDVIIRMFSI